MYKYYKYSFTSKVLINKSNEIVKIVSVNRNKYKKNMIIYMKNKNKSFLKD